VLEYFFVQIILFIARVRLKKQFYTSFFICVIEVEEEIEPPVLNGEIIELCIVFLKIINTKHIEINIKKDVKTVCLKKKIVNNRGEKNEF